MHRCSARRPHIHRSAHMATSAHSSSARFYSAPGEWHSIVARYDELLQPSDRVIGVTSDAVDASTGHAVPYPPLHLHHIHIQRSPAAHWYETHGDYDLISPKDGYYRSLPDGYCDYNEESAKRIVTTQINDVRYQADAAMSFNLHATSSASNRSKGPTLKWYLRLVLRLHGSNTQSRCKPVTKYIFWYKALFTSMDLTAPSTHPPLLSPHIIRYPVTKAAIADPLTRYWVPNTDAVFWWSLESPIAGRILHTRLAAFA